MTNNLNKVYSTLKKHFGNSATLLKQENKITIRSRIYLETDLKVFTKEKDNYTSLEMNQKVKEEIVIHF